MKKLAGEMKAFCDWLDTILMLEWVEWGVLIFVLVAVLIMHIMEKVPHHGGRNE